MRVWIACMTGYSKCSLKASLKEKRNKVIARLLRKSISEWWAKWERIRIGSLTKWFQPRSKEEYDQVERRAGIWGRFILPGYEELLTFLLLEADLWWWSTRLPITEISIFELFFHGWDRNLTLSEVLWLGPCSDLGSCSVCSGQKADF